MGDIDQTRRAGPRRTTALVGLGLIHLLVAADIWVLHLGGVSVFALASTACAAATLDMR
jgi:hypothetical protein